MWATKGMARDMMALGGQGKGRGNQWIKTVLWETLHFKMWDVGRDTRIKDCRSVS